MSSSDAGHGFGPNCTKHTELVNPYILTCLDAFGRSVSEQFAPLLESMRYSLEGSAKRLRPTLVLASAEAIGLNPKHVLPMAAAIEFIHTYSLIHDDLPAIDDDDSRRGKPSSHKKFGEDIAILTGDALLTEAFGLMARLGNEGNFDPRNVLKAISQLVQHAGIGGLVGGQLLDVRCSAALSNIPEIEFIHIHKTGALILASVLLPVVLSGQSEPYYRKLRLYGEALGLSFQISDDLLDSETPNRYSRGPRKKPKPSYTQLMTPTEARERLDGLVQTAVQSIFDLGGKAQALVEIARFVGVRRF